MEFGEYNSLDALRIQLHKPAFEKEYGHDTCDLVFETLPNIFKCHMVMPHR